MANTFLKATVIDRMALKLLEREIVLPKLVWSYASANFRAPTTTRSPCGSPPWRPPVSTRGGTTVPARSPSMT